VRAVSGPQRRIRIGAVVAVAAAVGLGVWLLVGNHSSGSKQSSSTGDGVPVPITAARLHTLAQAVPSLIYWPGPRKGMTYELTHTSTDRVRYLPGGVGVDKPYLTVATYPLANADATTLRASRQPGAVGVPIWTGAVAFYNRSRPQSIYLAHEGAGYQVEVFDLAGGGLVVVDTKYPKSIHLGYPGSDYQVEVFDPSPARELAVVPGGEVRPVG
jgi:hypothetical protein